MDINESIINETLRYLGCGGMSAADERTAALARQCAGQLAGRCRPRHISRRVRVLSAEGKCIRLEGGFVWESESLARAIAGCSEIMVFGATLGVEADMFIRRQTGRDITGGAVTSAAATALIEEYCDRVCQVAGEELKAQGHTLGERFSPGYGDFDLRHQKDLFAILDCPRAIGLTLTDELIMVPTKSVTAVMAIDGHCGRQLGCQYCTKTDCLYRRR